MSLPGGVAVPIRVGRELWGSLLVVARTEEWIPPDLEERLSTFAELVGLAITNTDTSARLLSQATSDPLTGLLNHRAFQERVESEVGRAQRYERPLTLVLLDLDFFKSINDAYGHQAGDTALMHAAGILERCARAGDVLGRIGGDEFALLLPETNAEQALPIAERWAAEFREAPVGVAAHLTMSAGVSDLTHANGSRELFRLADGALYAAKSLGRDTIVVYSPETVDEFSDSDRIDRMERMQSLAAIRSLARSVDSRDSPDGEHSERVGKMVRRLAEASGWTPARVALLGEAAEIHDVGKICVPTEVLRKPGRLTAPEYELVKAHAAAGAEMARDALERGTGGLDRPASRALRRHGLSQPARERADRRRRRSARAGRQLGRDDDRALLQRAEAGARSARRVPLARRHPVQPRRLPGARGDLLERSTRARRPLAGAAGGGSRRPPRPRR